MNFGEHPGGSADGSYYLRFTIYDLLQMANFLDILKERIVVFDGAMGTNIQVQNLTPDDFGGLDGCNEYLVVTKPEAVEKVHAGFLEVGCDVVETDTFGAASIV